MNGERNRSLMDMVRDEAYRDGFLAGSRNATPQPQAPPPTTEKRDDAPERIYLQVGDEDDATYPSGGCNGDEVTWCRDKIFERDVEYVRADLVARIESVADRIRTLEAEVDYRQALIVRLDKLLTGVANALKGEPPPLTLHSWHDLPELAAASRERERANEADARRWRWWAARAAVDRDSPKDWTCWFSVPMIPFRSKTVSVDELTDALIYRFPLATPDSVAPKEQPCRDR